jgi:D-tyrosyl-tRNA(Tyr) deacylase
MRAIVQRVSAATVRVDGREIGRCGYGLMLLVGVHRDDTEKEAKKLAEKISTLRIFNDPEGKVNLALVDFPAKGAPAPMYEYGVLAVSNFTVYGDAKSRRPSFIESAGFEKGQALFDRFVAELRALNIETQTGQFGANMEVALINDGPVTLVVDVDAVKSA